MNIYEKLAEARVRFLDAGVKPSGKNTFAKYSYYNLDDILPVINRINKELKIVGVENFNIETASLRIIDAEKPEDGINFTCPMSRADLKGCHEVQNLGAAMTYVKRYLYQNAYEISESDACNAVAPAQKSAADKPIQSQEKRQELINGIGNILKSKNPAGAYYFSEAEKNEVRELIKNTGHHPTGITILDNKKDALAEELVNRMKPAAAEPYGSAGGADIS